MATNRSIIKRISKITVAGLFLFPLAGLGASTAEPNAASGKQDPRMHPGEVRVLKLDNSNLREVIPGALLMKHWFGTDVSVAYFRFLEGQGSDPSSMPALHQHGEEWALQLKGSSTVIEEDGSRHLANEGDVFLIKPWIWHTGTFSDEETVLIGVISPPRADYPREGFTSFYPGQDKGDGSAGEEPQ